MRSAGADEIGGRVIGGADETVRAEGRVGRVAASER